MIQCPLCRRSLPVDIAGKVRCLCGHIFTADKVGGLSEPTKRRSNQEPCCHLGEQVGTADCDCKTKPRVYSCKLHGICLPRMTVTAAAAKMDDGTRATVSRCCRRCDDHTPADGLTYRQSIRIVTSFSPRRTDRQLACLATWRRLGMDIVAVQPASEIDAMAATYEGVTWIACDGQRPTIADLAAVAADGPILIINSDIAIESTMPEFRRDWLAIEDKTLRVGCRWEVMADGSQHLQRWGIDAFLITPAMLADFRDLGFRIGQPAWDYWMVIHYASLGYRIRAKIDRGLMHATHTQAWTKAEGREGVAIITDHYGIDRDEQNRRISKLTGRR